MSLEKRAKYYDYIYFSMAYDVYILASPCSDVCCLLISGLNDVFWEVQAVGCADDVSDAFWKCSVPFSLMFCACDVKMGGCLLCMHLQAERLPGCCWRSGGMECPSWRAGGDAWSWWQSTC
jgi:hypothetical protein